jgi:hypothetical protein
MARMTMSGAVAVTSRAAQAKSNNLLVPHSDHSAALGSAEVKVVGLVFSMVLRCDEFLKSVSAPQE